MSYEAEYDEFEDREARKWAMICHLAGFASFTAIPFAGLLAPFLIWMIKKDESRYVDIQGKEAINFQINAILYTIVLVLLCFVVIGFILLPLAGLAYIVLMIMAAIAANDGRAYRYPFIIRFL